MNRPSVAYIIWRTANVNWADTMGGGEAPKMPTYLYKDLNTGEIYELVQSMRDEAYTAHPETGAPVKRILARPAIAFKGEGFYVNDSRPKAKKESSSE